MAAIPAAVNFLGDSVEVEAFEDVAVDRYVDDEWGSLERCLVVQLAYLDCLSQRRASQTWHRRRTQGRTRQHCCWRASAQQRKMKSNGREGWVAIN